jgi:hypothetical protein
MEDIAWVCRVSVGRLTSESGRQKYASDARGRAAQNWLSEHGGGRRQTEKGASSVFDDSDEENGRPAPALAGSGTQKSARKSNMSFDELILSSRKADVQEGLRAMAVIKASARPDQCSQKSSQSKMETASRLKATFDSSCGSELDMTPFKDTGTFSAGKRALCPPLKPGPSSKRLKFPETEEAVGNTERVESELSLIDRLLDKSTSHPEPPKAAVKSDKSKKTMFNFAGRFDLEEAEAQNIPGSARLMTQEKSTSNIFIRSVSEKDKKARPAKSGASLASPRARSSKLPKENLEPVPPAVDIQNLVGSKVFDYESDETGSGKAVKTKTKMTHRTRPLQKEAKRRQSRTLAKMKERSQDLVYTSEEEEKEDGGSQKKQTTSKASKTGEAVRKKAAVLDKSQRRMDGFLTRSSRNRAIDISQLLEMPEEPTPRLEMSEEDLLQEERLRVLDAKLER